MRNTLFYKFKRITLVSFMLSSSILAGMTQSSAAEPNKLQTNGNIATSLINDSKFMDAFIDKLFNNQKFQQGLLNYFSTHPELLDALEIALEHQEANNSQIKTVVKGLYDSIQDAVYGPADAPITIVEFFDYNCSFCKEATKTIKKILAKNKNIKVITKETPVLSEDSVKVHLVAQAVRLLYPEKYIAFQSKLMSISSKINQERALDEAKSSGMDVDKIKSLLKRPETISHLKENVELANVLHLHGVPAFVIGNKVYAGVMSEEKFLEAIEESLHQPVK